MPGRHDFHKVIIGRSEELSFVDLEAPLVPSKADTGAYRSAVHARNIVLDEETGELSYEIFGGHPIAGVFATTLKTKQFSTATVENSFGQRQERYEVRLKVKLGPKVFFAKFTLADRSKKIYPILLGRKLLNNRFLVDSAKSSLNRIELKQKYGIVFPDDEEEIYDENRNTL